MTRTGDDDVVDVLWASPLGEIVIDPVNVVDVEKAAVGPPEEMGEFLDGVSLCGRVDDAEHLGKICLQELFGHQSPLPEINPTTRTEDSTYAIVQYLVLLLQRSQEGVLGKLVRADPVLVVGTFHLLLEFVHALRQQAREVEFTALILGESSALVEVRGVEQGAAGESTANGAARAQRQVGELSLLVVVVGCHGMG